MTTQAPFTSLVALLLKLFQDLLEVNSKVGHNTSKTK